MSTKEMLKFLAFAPFYVETWIEKCESAGGADLRRQDTFGFTWIS